MTATLPSQYPFPVSPGGLLTGLPVQPLRSYPSNPPPARPIDQGIATAPAVVSVTGLDSAGIELPRGGGIVDHNGCEIRCRVGLNPTGSGTVVILLASAAYVGNVWFACDWATLTVTNVSTTYTLTFSGGDLSRMIPGRDLPIACQILTPG